MLTETLRPCTLMQPRLFDDVPTQPRPAQAALGLADGESDSCNDGESAV